MLFNSFSYAVFLPVVVALYWLLPGRFRKPLLLVGSYIFYAAWLPLYGLLILGMTLGSFVCGLWLAHSGRKKSVLIAGLAFNLAILAFFKYAAFLTDNIRPVLSVIHIGVESEWVRRIILPLGISFFTFEFVHYTVDVYRGSPPIRSFVDFALFPAFFPTQIAGPIKRFQSFIPQLEELPAWDRVKFERGLGLIVQGLFKKVILADSLSVTVAQGFGNIRQLGFMDAWAVVLAFALQIYFDFSGYTDIGRGSAYLLGFSVPENFNLPYLAESIAEFWHRWHMTLSQWLRDYLFIPLGGSRVPRWKLYRNLFITMTLGGLWHGAAWTYVIWGMYHGVGLILHREQERLGAKIPAYVRFKHTRIARLGAVGLTWVFVCIGWVLFRAQSIELAGEMLLRLFKFRGNWLSSTITETALLELAVICLGYGALIWFAHRLGRVSPGAPIAARRWLLDAAYYSCLIVAIIVLQPHVSATFIYFRF